MVTNVVVIIAERTPIVFSIPDDFLSDKQTSKPESDNIQKYNYEIPPLDLCPTRPEMVDRGPGAYQLAVHGSATAKTRVPTTTQN